MKRIIIVLLISIALIVMFTVFKSEEVVDNEVLGVGNSEVKVFGQPI